MKFFAKVLPRKQRVASFPPPLADCVVVGDLHGRQDLLKRLLEIVDTQVQSSETLIFVGDLIDRGDQSKDVLLYLSQLQSALGPDRVVCLKGNHEDMLLNFIDNPVQDGPFWVQNGGLQTLASFHLTIQPRRAGPDDWNELAAALQNALGHQLEAWLRSLPTCWISGNVAVVHAGANPAFPIASQSPRTHMWGHRDFKRLPRSDSVWVVHGHTIVDQPTISHGVVSVDTGGYATGRLTAAIIQSGADIRFVST